MLKKNNLLLSGFISFDQTISKCPSNIGSLNQLKEGLNNKIDKKELINIDEKKHFYWITHNDTHYYSGYSETKFDDISFSPNDNNINDKVNTYSPFEYFGNFQIYFAIPLFFFYYYKNHSLSVLN